MKDKKWRRKEKQEVIWRGEKREKKRKVVLDDSRDTENEKAGKTQRETDERTKGTNIYI